MIEPQRVRAAGAQTTGQGIRSVAQVACSVEDPLPGLGTDLLAGIVTQDARRGGWIHSRLSRHILEVGHGSLQLTCRDHPGQR